jgi:hypothetical protein
MAPCAIVFGIVCTSSSMRGFGSGKTWVLAKGKLQKKLEDGTTVYLMEDIPDSKPKSALVKYKAKFKTSGVIDHDMYTENMSKHCTDLPELHGIFNCAAAATIDDVFKSNTVHFFELSDVVSITTCTLGLKGGTHAHSVGKHNVFLLFALCAVSLAFGTGTRLHHCRGLALLLARLTRLHPAGCAASPQHCCRLVRMSAGIDMHRRNRWSPSCFPKSGPHHLRPRCSTAGSCIRCTAASWISA